MALSKKTIIILVVLLVAAGVITASYALWHPARGGNLAVANPASVNCEQKGGQVEIRTGADGGQYGACVFANKSECEEWAFMRGECDPGNIGINFVKAGKVMNSAGENVWYFQYEEDGTALATAKLSFGQDSVCMSGQKQIKCDAVNLKADERVSVEGLKTDGTILVRRLREL